MYLLSWSAPSIILTFQQNVIASQALALANLCMLHSAPIKLAV